MILDAYYDAVRRLLGGGGDGKVLAKIGFGTGTSSVQPSDAALTDAFVKPVERVEFDAADPRLLRVHWKLERGEAVGMRITEIGLLCGDGTLVARTVRSPIEKTADLEIGDFWEIRV